LQRTLWKNVNITYIISIYIFIFIFIFIFNFIFFFIFIFIFIWNLSQRKHLFLIDCSEHWENSKSVRYFLITALELLRNFLISEIFFNGNHRANGGCFPGCLIWGCMMTHSNVPTFGPLTSQNMFFDVKKTFFFKKKWEFWPFCEGFERRVCERGREGCVESPAIFFTTHWNISTHVFRWFEQIFFLNLVFDFEHFVRDFKYKRFVRGGGGEKTLAIFLISESWNFFLDRSPKYFFQK